MAIGRAKKEETATGRKCGFPPMCMIHQILSSTEYVSYKERKALVADLKAVCAAVDKPAGLETLEGFAQRWDKKFPEASAFREGNWPHLSIHFKFL